MLSREPGVLVARNRPLVVAREKIAAS